MEWQPIESAPKDGELLLLFGPAGSIGPPGWAGEWWSLGRCEAGSLFTDENFDTLEPTHWMPLPPAPEREA